MSTSLNEKSLLSTLVTWFFVAILAIGALKMAFWVLGVVVGLGFHLLFTLGPILLIGWLVTVVVRSLTRPRTPPFP